MSQPEWRWFNFHVQVKLFLYIDIHTLYGLEDGGNVSILCTLGMRIKLSDLDLLQVDLLASGA